jgi:TonB family protein
MLHCGHVMRRILVLSAAMAAICCAAMVAMGVFAAQDSSQKAGKLTPAQFIQNARNAASLSLVGPVEIQADVKITPPQGKKEKGTYTLDWAAPDRFRREIHLPGYDEVSVANGTTLYRKRNTNYTPLDVFRLEELMEPDEVIARLQRDGIPSASSSTALPQDIVSKLIPPGTDPIFFSVGKDRCASASPFGESLCVQPNGQPVKLWMRDTGVGEILEYDDYQGVGRGAISVERKYWAGGHVLLEARLKEIRAKADFPADTFAPPEGAEKLDWCTDERPAVRLPFQGDLPIAPEDFPGTMIAGAFVNVDGTISRVQVLETSVSLDQQVIRKVAGLIRFSPATCADKPVTSESPMVIGEADIGMAGLANAGKLPMVGLKGYARPDCIRCPQPEYTDAAFDARIQGYVVLTAVIMPDGKARYVYVEKSLGLGLDESAEKAVLGWQFKPAVGPDGKPAAVRMLIAIDFHLY